MEYSLLKRETARDLLKIQCLLLFFKKSASAFKPGLIRQLHKSKVCRLNGGSFLFYGCRKVIFDLNTL